MILEFLFWLAIFIIFYTYIGYPLLAFFLASITKRTISKTHTLPFVSMIISSYNEEKSIHRKLENSLSIDYPADKFEVIVASDCSTDKTNEIVQGFSKKGVILHSLKRRGGKTAAQNEAISLARGDIVLFSDATTLYKPDILRKIVRNFSDPSIACVSGKVVFNDRGNNLTEKGLSLYATYQDILRSYEARFSSLLGASGCVYAVRKSLYEPLQENLKSDILVPLILLKKGFFTVYEPEAVAIVDRQNTPHSEFKRRIRMVRGSFQTLMHVVELLNPFKYKLVALSLISRRLLRWFNWFFLLLAFVTNIFLLNSTFYMFIFWGQVAFYFSAAGGFMLERVGHKIRALSSPVFFCLMNFAAFMGILQALRGESGEIWETYRRDS